MSQPLIPRDEQSGLLTRIAATESVSSCVRMKYWRRLWNQNPRSGMSDARKNGRLSHFRPEHLKGRLAGNPATG